MNLPFLRTRFIAAPALLVFAGVVLNAQVRSATQTNSATRVAAEMTKGRLNPTESKPGDIVSVRLKNDLKSNGYVVLKKGTTITGVVRNVKCADAQTLSIDAKAQMRSLIEIEWLTPASEGRAIPKISIALQSVTQAASSVHDETIEQGSHVDSNIAPGIPASSAGRSLRNSGGNVLPAEVVSATANPALVSMPFVVAVDHQTSTAIEGGLESSASGQLFKVGQGELMTASGSQQSVDLFSHLDNDTVIAASGKSFEISSGAQMQFLVGVHGAVVRR
jgi:hypothetical protein